MTESELVSVIIVNWNTRDLLLQCLQSIYDNPADTGCEVVVVDNSSSDGSVDAVRSQFPQAHIIANQDNRGFGAANNQGAAECKGDYLLFLNPDTIVQADAISVMRRFLAEEKDAGVVGCKILNSDGSVQPSYWHGFPSLAWCWQSAVYLHHRLDKTADASEHPSIVSHLLGACIMMRRNVFTSLAGFDERYFLYMEETDLCYRATLLGKRNYYLPGASVIHLGQQSTMQGAEWTNVQLQFSTYVFIRNTGNLSYCGRMLLLTGMYVGCAVRILLWTARLICGRPKRATSRLMLRGYWKLFSTIRRFESLYQKHSGQAAKLS